MYVNLFYASVYGKARVDGFHILIKLAAEGSQVSKSSRSRGRNCGGTLLSGSEPDTCLADSQALLPSL